MAKKKLSPEEQAELNVKLEKERILIQLENQKKDALNPFMPKNPTYFFEIGEKVIYGNHDNAVVTEIYENGLAYKLNLYGKKQVYHNNVDYNSHQIVSWIQIRKLIEDNATRPVFTKKDNVILRNYNSHLSSLFTNSYFFGLDTEVDYQREHVWSLEDKVALIDSIFKKIEIGKFIFIKRPHDRENKEHATYEVLDGKQRLTALKEFYEDRFTYKGLTFSQLSFFDQYSFTNYDITYMEADNLTEKQILETFIKFNTHGKIMSKEHLDKIQKRLDNLNNEK